MLLKPLKMKKKEQKGGFVPTLLDTLAARLFGSALSGKEVIWAAKVTVWTGMDV